MEDRDLLALGSHRYFVPPFYFIFAFVNMVIVYVHVWSGYILPSPNPTRGIILDMLLLL